MPADPPRPPARAPLLLATRSGDKLREIRILLGSLADRLITLDDAGIPESLDEDDLEVHDTFLANAHAKAAYFQRLSGLATIADDSGLCVDALNGAPGVRSKRFAPDPAVTGTARDRANNHHLLHLLREVPPSGRGAHYCCAAVLHTSDGCRFSALGIRTGAIADEPRGPHGFGYDPLFLDPATGLTFGELDPAAKHRTSHRARAFRALPHPR